jgi:hypothetical protein
MVRFLASIIRVHEYEVKSGNISQKCLYRSFITLHFQVSRVIIMTIATISMMHFEVNFTKTWTRFREETEKGSKRKRFGEVNAYFIH